MVKAMEMAMEMVKAMVVAVGNNPMMTGNHRSTPNHRPFGKCHAAGG